MKNFKIIEYYIQPFVLYLPVNYRQIMTITILKLHFNSSILLHLDTIIIPISIIISWFNN